MLIGKTYPAVLTRGILARHIARSGLLIDLRMIFVKAPLNPVAIVICQAHEQHSTILLSMPGLKATQSLGGAPVPLGAVFKMTVEQSQKSIHQSRLARFVRAVDDVETRSEFRAKIA